MTMTPKERVLAAMKQESLDRPPVAIFTQSATLGQMEKTGAAWPEAHKNAELMAKLGAAQADIFGFECCRAPFCLTAESERLGATVQVEKKDAAPMIKAHPFKFDPMTSEYDDPANLMAPEEFIQGGRPAIAIQAIELLAKSHGENYAIVAGNTGPFTLTGNLVNTENLVFGMMMCPEEVDKWVDAVNPIVTAYTHALMDAGAKYTVLHICGDTYPILDQMAATGVTGISIEEKVDPFKAVEKIGGKTVLVGNVGSVRPLFQGTVEETIEGTKKSVDAGFNVISSGCGIAVATPDENMKAMVDTVKSYGN